MHGRLGSLRCREAYAIGAKRTWMDYGLAQSVVNDPKRLCRTTQSLTNSSHIHSIPAMPAFCTT